MKTTLPNTVERIDRINPSIYEDELDYLREFESMILQWVNFIKQPLHPSMFMAWDFEKDCPMEKPNGYELYEKGLDSEYMELDYKVLGQYQQAKEKVIFKGFPDYEDWFASSKIAIQYHDGKFIYGGLIIKTIQDIVNKVDLVDWKFKELKL